MQEENAFKKEKAGKADDMFRNSSETIIKKKNKIGIDTVDRTNAPL